MAASRRQSRKERLYGVRSRRTTYSVSTLVSEKTDFNIPKYSTRELRNIEKIIEDIDKKYNGGDIEMLETSRMVEKFMRKIIYPEFTDESERKEARSFTIAVLTQIGAIPVRLLKDIIRSEAEDLYTKIALVYISNGRMESKYIDSYEDICDPSVVRKTMEILNKFSAVTDANVYPTIKEMVDELPKNEEECNPKNLPAIIETTYNSIVPGETQNGKIARNEWYNLEKEFGETLNGFNYTFFKIIDEITNSKVTILRLFDASNTIILCDRIIDEGPIMGLSTSLEVPVFVDGRWDSIYCNIKRHPDIIRWSLMNPASAVPEDYARAVIADMLPDPRIYFYVDFSCTSIDDLTPTEYKKFNESMTKIFNTFWQNNTPVYRMTLTEFANPTKFELVSDKQTVCHRDSCRDISPIDTIVKFEKGAVEVIQDEKTVNFSEVAANGGSVYGPTMNGLFSHLIIR